MASFYKVIGHFVTELQLLKKEQLYDRTQYYEFDKLYLDKKFIKSTTEIIFKSLFLTEGN